MQTGWFKEVHVKDVDSRSVRALLASRALLVKIKRDLENHVRGLLKNLGLVIGRAKFNVFAGRAEELIEDRPELAAAVRPPLEARTAVEGQVSELDRKVMKLVRRDAQVRRFMTVPGVGPITALTFKATIEIQHGLRVREAWVLKRAEYRDPAKRREKTSLPGRWRW
jgi:transposase